VAIVDPRAWVIRAPGADLRRPAHWSDRLRTWPSVPRRSTEIVATEAHLANARLFLAAAAIVGVYIDPAEPSRFPAVAYGLLWTYLGLSIVARAVIGLRFVTKRGVVALHMIDVVLPCMLMFVAEGPSSPFFVLLPFALLAAAYRWGYGATIVTGAVGIAVLLVNAAVVWTGAGPDELHAAALDPTRFVLRGVYLLVLTVLIGYLSERSHRSHAEASVLADLFGLVRQPQPLRQLLEDGARRLTELFGARGLVLAVLEPDEDRATVWTYRSGAERGHGIVRGSIPAGDLGIYFSGPEPIALGGSGSPAPELLAKLRWQSALAGNVPLGEAMLVRLYLAEPAIASGTARRTDFFATILEQIGPAVYSLHLLQRLRSRIASDERRWLARELHDGVVQSLLGLELELQTHLEREKRRTATPGTTLVQVRDGLRAVVLEARALIDELQRRTATASDLGVNVKRMAARLARETGINVEVLNFEQLADCTDRTAGLVARIVREALANVRKHSGARNVTIHYVRQGGVSRLVVADDGRGFQFSGELEGSGIRRFEHAPAELMERVAELRGKLSIESLPGAGSRVAVEWEATNDD
jgi:signal transduction histidine kinase